MRSARANEDSHSTVLPSQPREPCTAVIFSPRPQALEAGGHSHAQNSVPQYLEERTSPIGRFPSLSLLCRTCLPHPRGAAPRGWVTQPLSARLASPPPALRLRYGRARLGCRWTGRRRQLGQPGPGKRGTSGSGGTSPSPSGCGSSLEPRRSTWPWRPAGQPELQVLFAELRLQESVEGSHSIWICRKRGRDRGPRPAGRTHPSLLCLLPHSNLPTLAGSEPSSDL